MTTDNEKEQCLTTRASHELHSTRAPRPERLALRTTPRIVSALRSLASADGRTLSNYIERVLDDHIAHTQGLSHAL